MGVADVYKKVEDKWFALLDWLQAKGLPVYSIIDPLEDRGIPSMPVAVAATIILLVLVWFLLAQGAATVKVTSDGKALAGATVAFDGSEATTGSDGIARITISKETNVTVSKKDCEVKSVLVKPGESKDVSLTCRVTPPVGACSTIAEEYQQASIVGQNVYTPQGCSLRGINATGEASALSWAVDGNTLFLDSNDCVLEDTEIEIACEQHYLKKTVKDLRDEIELTGQITIPEKLSSGGDCDNDGIVDKLDDDNDNDGVPDAQDPDIDGDGIANANDADTCGVSTISQPFVPFTDCPDCAEPEKDVEDISYSTLVKVSSTEGALEGILVKAVDEAGRQLTVKGIVSTSTAKDGTATLRLPSGTEYYVRGEDPKSAYQSATSTKQKQDGTKEVTLTLSKGTVTRVTVKDNASGSFVGNARVLVKLAGKTVADKRTGSDGRATLSLAPATSYAVQITHDDYVPLTASLTGGADAVFSLSKIDESNSATLRVKAVNAKGIEEPLPDVRVVLVTPAGLEYKECVTPSDGRCSFPRTLAGTYHFEATAPGVLNPQKFPDFALRAGEPSDQVLKVDPATVKISVSTLVNGNPTKGVRVKLYDLTYGVPEELGSQKSGDTRKAEFSSFRGKKVFINAEYEDETGQQFGPLNTNPFTLEKDVELTVDLTKVARGFDLQVAPTFDQGVVYPAKVRVDLPYEDEAKRTKYKNVIVEVLVGDPGSKSNPLRTPILIGSIDVSAFSKQQKPTVVVSSADEAGFTGGTGRGDPTATSKYVKFAISNYDVSTYEITIPVFARKLSSGEAKIYYRATWEGRAKVSSPGEGWSEKTVKITPGEGDWVTLTAGPFSAYRAWLSESPDVGMAVAKPDAPTPEQAKGDALFASPPAPVEKAGDKGSGCPDFCVSDGSIAFFHVEAIAAEETDNYAFQLESFPPLTGEKHLLPLAYQGLIERTGGNTTTIFATEVKDTTLPSQVNPAREGIAALYALGADDKVHMVFAMRANKPVKSAELVALNDLKHTVKYTVNEVQELTTDIPNVVATLSAQAEMCPPKGYLGDCAWGEFALGQTLPSYSVNLAQGRNVRIVINLINRGDADQAASLLAQGSGLEGLDFDNEVTIPKGGTASVTITGKGNSLQNNLLDIFLWKKDLQKPAKAWQGVTHGPVDYELEVTALDSNARALPVNKLATNTKTVVVRVLQKDVKNPRGAGIVENVFVEDHANAVKLTLPGGREEFMPVFAELGTEPVFRADGLAFSWGFASFKAEHPGFVSLEKSIEVNGVQFLPGEANASFVLDDKTPSKNIRFVTAKNNWDEAVTVKLTEKADTTPTAGQKDTFGVKTELHVFDAAGNELEPSLASSKSREMPSRGKAELRLVVNPPGTECNIYQLSARLETSAKTKDTQVEAVNTQQFTFSCKFSQGPVQKPTFKGVVMREFVQASKATADSCVVDGKTARVCDSEQFGKAVLALARQLDASNSVALTRFYALADDVVTPVTLDVLKSGGFPAGGVVAKATGTEGEFIVPDRIGCGIVRVDLQKTQKRSIEWKLASDTVDATAPWCANGFAKLLGMVNWDDNLRNKPATQDIVRVMSIESDSDVDTLFIAKGLETIKPNAKSVVFGPAGGQKDFASARPRQFSLLYEEFASSAFPAQKSKDARYRWIQAAKPMTGYYDINLDTGDVLIGVVYQNKDNLDRARTCMVSNLVKYWQTGAADGMKDLTGNQQQEFDLDKCVEQTGVALPTLDYIVIDAKFPEYKADAPATRVKDVSLRLGFGADPEISVCYVWNGHDSDADENPARNPDNKYERDQRGDWTAGTLSIDAWDLDTDEERTYYVKAVCATKDEVFTARKDDSIVFDETAPTVSLVAQGSVVGDSSTGLGQLSIAVTARDKFKVSSCSVEAFCPSPSAISGTCQQFTPATSITTTCSLSNLLPNADPALENCVPKGDNQYRVSCTDENGNTGPAEKSVFVLTEGAPNPIIQEPCKGDKQQAIGAPRAMFTDAGDTCFDTFKEGNHLFYDGTKYLMGGQASSVTIPIYVSSKNPGISCSAVYKRADQEWSAARIGTTRTNTDVDTGGNPRQAFFDSTINFPADGEYDVRLSCSDQGGGTSSKTLRFIVDKTPPSCSITGGEDVTTKPIFLEPWSFARTKGSLFTTDVSVTSNDNIGVRKTTCTASSSKELAASSTVYYDVRPENQVTYKLSGGDTQLHIPAPSVDTRMTTIRAWFANPSGNAVPLTVTFGCEAVSRPCAESERTEKTIMIPANTPQGGFVDIPVNVITKSDTTHFLEFRASSEAVQAGVKYGWGATSSYGGLIDAANSGLERDGRALAAQIIGITMTANLNVWDVAQSGYSGDLTCDVVDLAGNEGTCSPKIGAQTARVKTNEYDTCLTELGAEEKDLRPTPTEISYYVLDSMTFSKSYNNWDTSVYFEIRKYPTQEWQTLEQWRITGGASGVNIERNWKSNPIVGQAYDKARMRINAEPESSCGNLGKGCASHAGGAFKLRNAIVGC
jgi:hypothetical protein